MHNALSCERLCVRMYFCLCVGLSDTAEGFYIYADSSNGEYGNVSDLITPTITATGPQCTMEFWYYMSGFTVGTLQVDVIQVASLNLNMYCI